jgi:hypothetical protein
MCEKEYGEDELYAAAHDNDNETDGGGIAEEANEADGGIAEEANEDMHDDIVNVASIKEDEENTDNGIAEEADEEGSDIAEAYEYNDYDEPYEPDGDDDDDVHCLYGSTDDDGKNKYDDRNEADSATDGGDIAGACKDSGFNDGRAATHEGTFDIKDGSTIKERATLCVYDRLLNDNDPDDEIKGLYDTDDPDEEIAGVHNSDKENASNENDSYECNGGESYCHAYHSIKEHQKDYTTTPRTHWGYRSPPNRECARRILLSEPSEFGS